MKFKTSLFNTRYRFGCIFALILFTLPTHAGITQEFNTWSYHKALDRSTNLEYSLARSPMPKRGLYDLIRLEFVCKDNRLQMVVDSNSLITSQNRTFDFEYRIDNNPPVTIQMRTFPDSKRRAYTDEHARQIAEAMLTGKSVFVRIHTLIKKVLSGAMPLDDAVEPITRVFADCGMQPGGVRKETADYSLSDFASDLSRLTAAQQKQVMNQLRQMIKELEGQ